MFWKKKIQYPFLKECWLYVSPDLNEVIFVPVFKSEDLSARREQEDGVIVEPWPMDSDSIGKMVILCYKKCKVLESWGSDVWPSFSRSKAKTIQKFETERYILFSIFLFR